MKLPSIVFGTLFLAASIHASQPHREKYYAAPGSVTYSGSQPTHDDHDSEAIVNADEPVIYELEAHEVTPAIEPDSLAARDSLNPSLNCRGECPSKNPWLCDRLTCFNRFKHNCCKGGRVCPGNLVCVELKWGNVSCKGAW